MNMQKKGQGLPLSTVILAILGILVLVIIAAPLTSYIAGTFSNQAQGCISGGGACFVDRTHGCYQTEGAFARADVTKPYDGVELVVDSSCSISESKCCPRGYAVAEKPSS